LNRAISAQSRDGRHHGGCGNDELEFKAWEQMLEIYPANRQAQERLGELADKLSGSRI
jgi:hypothetical protein